LAAGAEGTKAVAFAAPGTKEAAPLTASGVKLGVNVAAAAAVGLNAGA